MVKRSLKASPEGISRAKRAFERKGWTQEYLAFEIGLQTRQPVWKFFSGRPVERHVFLELCFTLDLDWEEIVERPTVAAEIEPAGLAIASQPAPQESVASLIAQVRSHLSPLIQSQCCQLELPFEFSCPLTLSEIYTETYLYPRRSGRSPEATGMSERVSLNQVISQFPRLLILGGAGTGKTTLMQYLALQALEQADGAIPILIRLRHLAPEAEASFDLQASITQFLAPCERATSIVDHLCRNQAIWLLLDGWDEMAPSLQMPLTQQLQVLLDRHPSLQLIITSRPGGLTPALRGLIPMDLAEFAPHQVDRFVQRWFQANEPHGAEEWAGACLKALKISAHGRFQAFSLTPMLLHLICLVFWHHRQFPMQPGQLYQQALELLMGRWDQQRGVVRDRPFTLSMTVFDMLKLLSQIATHTFERNQMLMPKTDLVMLIAQFLSPVMETADPEQRWATSQHILQILTEHYGILVEHAYETYSFSHLSFQEYLVARRWAITAVDRHTPEDWIELARHLGDERWCDVITFIVEMIPDADGLVRSLQQQAQALLADDPALLTITAWAEARVNACQWGQTTALQALYLGLFLQDVDLAITLDPEIGLEPPSQLILDRAVKYLLDLAQELVVRPSLQAGFNLYFAMDLYRRFDLEFDFAQGLKELHGQLAEVLETPDGIDLWGQGESILWLEQLHHLCIHYHLCPSVQALQATQQQRLQQFYQAQQLIASCAKRRDLPLPCSLFPISCHEY